MAPVPVQEGAMAHLDVVRTEARHLLGGGPVVLAAQRHAFGPHHALRRDAVARREGAELLRRPHGEAVRALRGGAGQAPGAEVQSSSARGPGCNRPIGMVGARAGGVGWARSGRGACVLSVVQKAPPVTLTVLSVMLTFWSLYPASRMGARPETRERRGPSP